MKNKPNPQLTNLIKQAVDLHVHIGPEVIPRKYTVEQLIQQESGNIAAIALKNHFYPTTSLIESTRNKSKLKLIGSVVLNNYVGGLNADAVYSTNMISSSPIIVWFPTISSTSFLQNSKYEIPPEWVQGSNFKSRLSKDIKGISLLDKSGTLVPKAVRVLKAVKETESILATGHISSKESIQLVKRGLRMGIEKIIVTHPIYQRIDMSLDKQADLVANGCLLEMCYSMYSIDNISIKQIVKQIKYVGATGFIISSDVGQAFSQSPSKSLYRFAELLLENGISMDELQMMLVSNPNELIKIKV